MKNEKTNHADELLTLFPGFSPFKDELLPRITYRHVNAKTILLPEGEKARYLYLVLKGSLRIFFIKSDGKEITAQFFFSGGIVGSMESVFTGLPSRMHLETLEESVLGAIRIDEVSEMVKRYPPLGDLMLDLLKNRLLHYVSTGGAEHGQHL